MSKTGRPGRGAYPHEPLAKCVADLVAPSQLVIISTLAVDLELDPDVECRSVMGCRPEELSKIAAAFFIGHLRRVADASPREGGEP